MREALYLQTLAQTQNNVLLPEHLTLIQLVDIASLIKLKELIVINNWQRFDHVFNKKQTIEKSLIDFLSQMRTDEINLYLDLLDSYLILRDYTESAITIAKSLSTFFPDNSYVNLCALKASEGSEIKSGQSLIYEIKSVKAHAEKINLKFFDSPFSEKFQESEGHKVIVDDFMGSGNQFNTMTTNLRDAGLNTNFNLVVGLVMQEEAKSLIENMGFNTHCLHLRSKSLSASANPDALTINDRVEKRIGVSNKFLRGYSGSEATVTLKRTPNNTLPAFWFGGAHKWLAPFPR